MGPDDLLNRFTYHPPSSETGLPRSPEVFEFVRSEALAFARVIDDLVPDGREKSLAITKIEETVFWANAGIARSE